MRLEALILEKYGVFENLVLKFRSDAALHVVLGANEAGKSTSLQAISDFLFAFPAKIEADDSRVSRFKSADLRIGGILRLDDTQKLDIRRKSGRANTLLGPTDKDRIEGDPMAAVRGALDKATFESEFGLNARSLRAGAHALLAANGKLAETLAAGSSGLAALSRLKGALTQDAERLYASGTRSKEFNLALRRYEDVEKALRDAIVTSEALKRARETLDTATQARSQREETHRDAARALARLQRTGRTHRKLQQLREAEEALLAFADLPPADAAALERWSDALSQTDGLVEKIASKASEIAQKQREAEALALQPGLLEQAAQIEILNRGLGAALKDIDDLPRRQETMRIHGEALEAAAMQLGLASAQVMTERLPNRLALAKVQNTLRRKLGLEKLSNAAKVRLDKARQRRQELETESPAPEAVGNPADLTQTFETFASFHADAERLRQLEAEYAETVTALETRAVRLHPSAGPLSELVRKPLPDSSVLDAALHAVTGLADARRSLEGESQRIANALAERVGQIVSLADVGLVRTVNDWLAVRSARDEALQVLAEAGEAERRAAIARLRETIAAADVIAENLLNHADHAARKQTLTAEIERLKQQAEETGLRLDRQQEAETVARANWRSGWSPSGIDPLPPAQMQAWLREARDIIDQYATLGHKRAAIAAATEKFGKLSATLFSFAESLGMAGGADQSGEVLYARTHQMLQNRQRDWNATREHASNLKNAMREIADIEKEMADLDRQGAAIQADWDACMETLSLSASAGPAEADEALAVWNQAAEDHGQFTSFQHRVTTLQRDIAAFEGDVDKLANAFCPELSGETAQHRVDALMKRLQDARRAKDDAQRLAKETGILNQQAESLAAERGRLARITEEATSALRPAEGLSLRDVLERARRRQEIQQEAAALAGDLAQVSDGRDIAALRAEQEGVDPDALEGDIERQHAAGEMLLADIAPAAVAEQAARHACETLYAGSDAPALAQEKAEAEAELLDIARNWLVRASAARLAGFAIERHRQQAQDPVLARISGLFQMVTAGAFQGISLDYDEEDQPVFRARRAGGEIVPIAGLSEGTADQLYLALRLALLEQRKAEPLPFIGDDLLTSFDDKRTGQALDMLAAFGAGRQAILFTHHRHVAEIAAQRLGDRLDLIEIGG